HLLVTDKPVIAKPELKDLAAYRDAAWLLKRQAVTVLPSVASLKALRGLGTRNAPAASPLIGFGDPIFESTAPVPPIIVAPKQGPAPPRGKQGPETATATAPKSESKGAGPAPAPKSEPKPTRLAATRGYAEFWSGGAVDRDSLARALPRLEDTAD